MAGFRVVQSLSGFGLAGLVGLNEFGLLGPREYFFALSQGFVRVESGLRELGFRL